ncbi:unnamed protein product [Adineta ricciae]|uniref:Uncharacterized protein n=1 Tax=Adineta ricciae TaxID=249248 RepID=A0A814P8Y7_ADIRI|nr:unnamed protein product [Adineta ricciae]
MDHNSTFVYAAQRRIVEFLKENYSRVKKINYVSDGAVSHFKNNNTIKNLIYHKKDFGLQTAWTFSAAGHGKSQCDGIGAMVKATATRAALQGSSGANIQTALDFWNFTFDANDRSELNEPSPIESYFIPTERVDKLFKEKLEKRWKDDANIKLTGIRKYHQFNSLPGGRLSCRTVSTSSKEFYFRFKS